MTHAEKKDPRPKPIGCLVTTDDDILGAYIYDLVNAGLTNSTEMQMALDVYGREKIEEVFRTERKKRKPQEGAPR